MAQTHTTTVDGRTARILILDTIRANVRKFKHLYGPTVVVAIDDKEYWRRERFIYYKHHRKDLREKSQFDWDAINTLLNTVKQEIRENLPYKVLTVPKAEADDIIAVLTRRFSTIEKLVIVSTDKDFKQLHTHKNVTQYSPVLKKFITHDAPHLFLKEQIIRGDAGDGIPNILSPDNAFADKIRQKPIYDKKIVEWLNQEPADFCTEDMLRNYKRNEMLISFLEIPTEVSSAITAAYDTYQDKGKSHLFDYLREQQLMPLLEVIDEF